MTAVEDQAVLPAAARLLLEHAEAHGWLTRVTRDVDTGGSPFLVVDVGIRDPTHHYQVTWHTRGTGTYRLFTRIGVTSRGGWRDIPSLRHIRKVISAHPQAPEEATA